MSTLEASNNNNNILTTEREYFSLKNLMLNFFFFFIFIMQQSKCLVSFIPFTIKIYIDTMTIKKTKTNPTNLLFCFF